MEVSKAEYLLFVDADDWIAEYTVEELYEIAQRDCVDLVVPGMIYAFDKKEEHHRLERNYYSGMQFLEALLEERVPHNTASCLYKKSVFVDIPWEQCEKLFMGDDLVLSIFVASHGISAETLNREYYYYYQNADSMTHVAYEKIVKIYDALEVIRLYLQKQGLADKYQQQIDFLFYLHGIHYHGIMPFQRNLGVRKQLALRWKSLGINIYENPCYQDFVKRQPLSKRIFMKSYQYSFYLNYVLGVIIMPVFNCLKGR